MIRRASFSLLPVLACAAFAACATHTPPPTPAAASPPPVAPVPQAPDAPSTTALPPVPQPPARPVAPPPVTDPAIPRDRRIDAFVDYTVRTYGVDARTIRDTLAQAETRQSILNAMSRPAEGVKPWRDYRPIFLNADRIDAGRAFLAQHRDALQRISAQSGVPAEYIVAIIGVETSYGRITGNYRVLDALYTLAFDWPRRAPFFAGELAQLFALAQEESLDIGALQGSYAGAMGWGQFMPSSYRLWAKDGDGDGRRDLLLSVPDVFASIANYFVVHGWQRGAPVIARASRDAGAADFIPGNLEPVHPLPALAARGYRPQPGQPVVADGNGATLLTLDGAGGKEYWLGYRNFYVISRYNHSPMYSLAVHQLAQAIAGAPAQGTQ